MTAPLLPSSPVPAKPGQASDSKAARASDKHGDSEFDAISRQERKRLERHSDGDDQQDRASQVRQDRQSGAGEGATASGQSRHDAQAQDAETAEVSEPDRHRTWRDDDHSALFTFASAQAANGLPAMGVMGGMVGQAGAEGELMPALAIQQANGLESGGKVLPGQPATQVLESLLGQASGDSGKALDSASGLASLNRLGAAEQAGQMPQPQTSARLIDATTPLRAYATSIDLPVGHAEWGDKLVGKLTWLTANNLSVAEIHLTPPDMGPMEVRVQVQQDQASVTVHAANAAVRDQLELHSHRLRDLLNQQGIALDQFDVSDSPGRHDRDRDSGDDEGRGVVAQQRHDDEDSLSRVAAGGQLDLSWRGEVDLYA
ncbi:flagellar hook-length control protein FliK [Marinobacter sp. SS21]|uniref:flagellar hook-length control protein FliK n=1 Tax=Marinobacter sp. SS21 TaxID=2979460 RepID=UPI00232A82FB|nr:flagellar hook-length control protein FliK [Marinobacter sp. SS21]MDC0662165.1 flagellar hook-length control protein FliK [Marinobacter sp. SS21]